MTDRQVLQPLQLHLWLQCSSQLRVHLRARFPGLRCQAYHGLVPCQGQVRQSSFHQLRILNQYHLHLFFDPVRRLH